MFSVENALSLYTKKEKQIVSLFGFY